MLTLILDYITENKCLILVFHSTVREFYRDSMESTMLIFLSYSFSCLSFLVEILFVDFSKTDPFYEDKI